MVQQFASVCIAGCRSCPPKSVVNPQNSGNSGQAQLLHHRGQFRSSHLHICLQFHS
jgi:hypothetical protein